MKRLLLVILLLEILTSCKSQDCRNLPDRFSSYSQAVSLVKRSSFKIEETANTSNSSWITSAKYYSCDGSTGYFIYTTNKGAEYIHKAVPISVWKGFKTATSKGLYYNTNIKNRYQLKL